MQHPNSNHSKDHAVAKLALQLSPNKPAGNDTPPSNEELAALYDNKLTHARKEEVLAHIASNENIYRRWINLIESISVSNQFQASSTVKIDAKPQASTSDSLWKKISHWWETSSDFTPILGSGLAIASVITFTVMLVPLQQNTNLSDELSNFYEQYGVSLSTASSTVEPPTNFSTKRSFIFTKDVSITGKVIQTGFITGSQNINANEFKKWGYDIDKMQITSPAQASSFSTSQYNILFEIGRLTALTTLPCQVNPRMPDTEKFYTISKQLINALNKSIPDQFLPLKNNFLQQTNKSLAVCEANTAISLIILP